MEKIIFLKTNYPAHTNDCYFLIYQTKFSRIIIHYNSYFKFIARYSTECD